MLALLARRFWDAVTRRSDIEDLYRSTHAIRQRLIAAEAMVVALAWTHPDSRALIERVHEWMAMPSGDGLTDFLRELQRTEHARVTRHWQSLVDGASTSAVGP